MNKATEDVAIEDAVTIKDITDGTEDVELDVIDYKVMIKLIFLPWVMNNSLERNLINLAKLLRKKRKFLNKNSKIATDVVVTEDVVTTRDTTDGIEDAEQGVIEFVLNKMIKKNYLN